MPLMTTPTKTLRATISGPIESITQHYIPSWYMCGPVYLFTVRGDPVSYATTAPRFQHVREGDIVTVKIPIHVDGTQILFDGTRSCPRIIIVSIVRDGVDVTKALHEQSRLNIHTETRMDEFCPGQG